MNLRLCFQSGRTEGLSIEPGWNIGIGIGILASVANKSKKKLIRLKHGGYASMQPCLSTSVAEDVKGPYSFVSSWNLMTMLRRHWTSTLGQAFPANKIKMSLLALKTNEWCPFVPYISAAPVQGFNPVNGNPIISRGTLHMVTDRHPLSRVFVCFHMLIDSTTTPLEVPEKYEPLCSCRTGLDKDLIEIALLCVWLIFRAMLQQHVVTQGLGMTTPRLIDNIDSGKDSLKSSLCKYFETPHYNSSTVTVSSLELCCSTPLSSDIKGMYCDPPSSFHRK